MKISRGTSEIRTRIPSIPISANAEGTPVMDLRSFQHARSVIRKILEHALWEVEYATLVENLNRLPKTALM